MDLMVSSMTKQDGAWNCNLKCLHCYAAGQPQAVVRELDAAQWKKIIDRLRSAGVPQLTFTGGEPTMRPDLVELVDELEEMDRKEDWSYFDRCGFIENITKEFVINKEMTSKQRDILCQRYRGG